MEYLATTTTRTITTTDDTKLCDQGILLAPGAIIGVTPIIGPGSHLKWAILLQQQLEQ